MKQNSTIIDYFKALNEPQRSAVAATEGPVMVIAGAGAGKTRVLTYRIAQLMKGGTDAFRILALTFTNKAAREMRARIAEIVGVSEVRNLWMGTFHSVFARILRSEGHRLGYPSHFTIYDTQDSVSVLTQVIKEKGLDKDVYRPKLIQSRISQFKNNLITAKAYQRNAEWQAYDAASKRPKTGEIYAEYANRCFRAGAMDFDDLLLQTNALLTRFPAVLAAYQNRFRYLMVDEYQDTNHAQYLIVKALAARYENVCVVGDDAQSIYSFRGANIRNIFNFQKDYPDAQILRLEQNYRSTKCIIGAANSVIKKNKEQLEKNLWTKNQAGAPLQLYRAYSGAEEGAYIARTLFEEKAHNRLKNSDFAILYRTNAQSRALEDALRKKNIPYRVYGGLSFYQRKEIKDLVAYLRFLVNPADEEALARIINFPRRGIGQTTVDKLTLAARQNGVGIYTVLANLQRYDLPIHAGMQRKLVDFYAMVNSLQTQMADRDAFDVAKAVAERSGLLREIGADKTPEGVSRYENIQELLNGVKGFVNEQRELADGNPTLVGFLENIALATDWDKDGAGEGDAVSLMTIHLSKGLEFPYVFIAGLEENLFPALLSTNSRSELEEERRLFYVALTRAENKVFLTYALSRFRWGRLVDNEPSRFLFDIDEKYLTAPALKSLFDSPARPRHIFSRQSDAVSRKKPIFVDGKSLEPPSGRHLGRAAETIQLRIGDRVEHKRFGIGLVMSLAGKGASASATVRFDNVGEKKLLLKFARLEKRI